jgi:hypothetical protein
VIGTSTLTELREMASIDWNKDAKEEKRQAVLGTTHE